MRKERKEVEFPEAPSGYVLMYNYKEPFMPYSKGFGYQGCLVFDGKSDRVQCHLCGGWYHALGNHLHREHNMKASDYKTEVGLSQTTALISESYREKLIASGQERFRNLRPGKKHTKETKEKIRATLKNVTREKENQRGTCPLQLIDRIHKLVKSLGRIPSCKEVTFEQTIRRVFGSWNKALEMAGYTPLKPGQNRMYKKTTYEEAYKVIQAFWIDKHRFPKWKEVRPSIYNIYRKNKSKMKREIMFGSKQYQKTGHRIFASKEDLLALLRNFRQEYQRDPSISDCKRGLLPHASRYYYHFGTFAKAVKQI